MVDNRVQKHAEYRNSASRGSYASTNDERERLTLTKQLPLETVMEAANNSKKEIEEMREELKKKYLRNSILAICGVSLIFIIIIIAIVIFRR